MSVQLSLTEGPKASLLSAAAYQKIDREIAKYPADQKQSAVMAALAIAQTEKGWISPELEAEIAAYLSMPAIAVHEVASFYTMYTLKPPGKYKLTLCTNLPCALRSGNQAAEYLKAKLGIGFNDTTADGLFTLKEGECMGACGDSPVMLVNNHRMCSWMSNDKIDALIAELTSEGSQHGRA
jgi:NADH-quinone oxidoreductase subunit E